MEDEEYWIACWLPTSQGTSRVYYQHQDEPELSRREVSIAALLTNPILEDTADEQLTLPAVVRERWAKAQKLCFQDDTPAFSSYLDAERAQDDKHTKAALKSWLADALPSVP